MTPAEVISEDAQRSGSRPGAAMNYIAIAMDKRKAFILHDNKSVLLLDPIDKDRRKYAVHLFTVDSPIGLLRSVKNLIPEIQGVYGLEYVYGNTKDPQVIQMIRAAGVDVLKSDNPKFTWMAEA
jgi:hypothetical protein